MTIAEARSSGSAAPSSVAFVSGWRSLPGSGTNPGGGNGTRGIDVDTAHGPFAPLAESAKADAPGRRGGHQNSIGGGFALEPNGRSSDARFSANGASC